MHRLNFDVTECVNAGAVFDGQMSDAAEMRQALQREVWRYNNRSVATSASPQLLVYDTGVDMSRQFQLSKSRKCRLTRRFSVLIYE